MFAIIETSGKQYRVRQDDKLKIDNLNKEIGEKIIFDKVLFLQNQDGSSLIGAPTLQNVVVEAEVIKNYKDKKIIIFKKRRRKNSRRKRGHRQQKTELKILSIKA
jgi:large subunit ribosomal protein L21